MEQIEEMFQAQLLDRLEAGGYLRDAWSARFNLGLDMLTGNAECEDDVNRFRKSFMPFIHPIYPINPTTPVKNYLG